MRSNILKVVLIVVSALIGGINILVAQSPVPHSNYGVWNRGADPSFDPNDPRYDYLIGVTTGPAWADIQPDNSTTYDWTTLQEEIDTAFARTQLISIKINVGPQCPDWIYDEVTPVFTTGHKFTKFPYYLDPVYINHYYNMIDSFANFIYTQPQEKQDLLSFIFPQNGATGDEVPYKGDYVPGNEIYDLDGDQWRTFRINSWEHWQAAFRNDDNRKIPFLFNDVYPDTEEWEWVRDADNIGEDFGIKNANAYSRGHHLSHEEDFYETFHDSLVDPQGLALFNRAEMDQSWTEPIYNINTNLGFYWGAISGINSGLSVWDVTTNALEYARTNNSVTESFRFFTKYAGQIKPEVSTKAFIALHEGLNSADTDKFPENIYGDAKRSEVSRYENICNAPMYASRGARIDDTIAVVKGQVFQRENQTGYNDAGWEIWPTNYSRFITQIDPEAESIGLFRIGGEIDGNSSIYSRFARAFENSTGRNAMYFKMHDDFYSSAADSVKISIIYYDTIAGSTWQFQYDAGSGNFKTAETITCTGSNTWMSKLIVLTDAVMLHNGPGGADFALINNDNLDDIFHMIEVEKLDGSFVDNVSIKTPYDGDVFYEGDPVIVDVEGFDFQGIAAMRFKVDNDAFIDVVTTPYTHVYNNLDLGNHTLLVQMLDEAGNTINAELVHITVEVVPIPDEVYITSPQNGDVFQLTAAGITVSAFGYDNQNIDVMRFKANSGDFENVDTVPYFYTFTDLVLGQDTFVVQMKDDLCDRILSEAVTITLIDQCPDELVLSNIQNTDSDYQAANKITSSQIIGVDVTQVTYDATNEITLSPNFEVPLGTEFHAFINGCSPSTINAQINNIQNNNLISEEATHAKEVYYHIDDTDVTHSSTYDSTVVVDVLNWKFNNGIDQISIFNIEGREIFNRKANNSNSINLSILEKGLYWVYFQGKEMQTIKQKIIKL